MVKPGKSQRIPEETKVNTFKQHIRGGDEECEMYDYYLLEIF
jgi:hypothetical protein